MIRRTVSDEIDAEAREIFEADAPLLDLRRYWRVLRRHPRVVLGMVLVALIAAAVHLIGETPIYTAETTILIEPQAARNSDTLEDLVEIEAAAANADEYYKTQCAILQSRNLAARVIDELGLARNPVFGAGGGAAPAPPQSSASALEEVERDPAALDAARAPAAAVRAYLAMLKVAPVADTNLVRISFTTPDPALSARLANAHVAAYQREQSRMRGDETAEAQRFLRDKLAEIRDQLQKSEVALNDYRRAKGIIPGLISLDGKNAVVLDRLSDLSKDLTQAQVARIALEAQIESINKRDYASLPEAAHDQTIADLDKQLNELYSQAAALSSQFKPDYPPLAKLQAQIGAVEARLNAATAKIAGSIEVEYRQAQAKENELQAEMERTRAETLNLNDSATQYSLLQREVDTNRELYNAVLTRMKDVSIASGGERTNVAVINSADVPTVPTSPRKARDLSLALMVGLAGGIGLAFLLESLDNTLKNPEEVEHYLGLPSLGLVPEFGASNKALPRYRPRGLIRAAPPGSGELVTVHGSYSALGEAYRNLRTALLLSRAGAPPKTLLITSATSREGKTVSAVNIAVMFAQSGAATLLIDADLRRARCHHVLALESGPGLTEALTGACAADGLAQSTMVPLLDFLGAGAVPPNPTELLGSGKMAETLNLFEDRYQYIVIDSSPVLPVSDALLLAQLVDGVIVIANSQVTAKQQVRTACARLEYARGKILGLVLNRVRLDSPELRYYYHSEYHANAHGGAREDA